MRVIFLDIATQTGCAVDGPRETGRPFISSFNCGSDGNRPGRAFYEYERWLDGVLVRFRPQALGYEAALQQKRGEKSINSAVTNAKLFGLIAITTMLAYAHDLTPRPCNVNQIRRHFVGNGSADKKQVVDRCRMLGWGVANEDEADACAGYDYMHGLLKAEQLTRGKDGRVA